MSLGLALAKYGQAVQRVAAAGGRLPVAEAQPASVTPISPVRPVRGAEEAALALLGREAVATLIAQPGFEDTLRRCVQLLEQEASATAGRAVDPPAPLRELVGRVMEVYLDRPAVQVPAETVAPQTTAAQVPTPELTASRVPAAQTTTPAGGPTNTPGQLSLLVSAARGQDHLAELLLTTGLQMPATQTAGETALVEAYRRLAQALAGGLPPEAAVDVSLRAAIVAALVDAYANLAEELLSIGAGEPRAGAPTADSAVGAGAAPRTPQAAGPASRGAPGAAATLTETSQQPSVPAAARQTLGPTTRPPVAPATPAPVVPPPVAQSARNPGAAPSASPATPGPDAAPSSQTPGPRPPAPSAAPEAPYKEAFGRIIQGHQQIARELAESGLNLRALAEHDRPAALRIVLQGHQRLAAEVLANGIPVPPSDPAVPRPAFVSVIEGHQRLAGRLLAAGADAGSLSPVHQTVLLRTVLESHRDTAAQIRQLAGAPLHGQGAEVPRRVPGQAMPTGPEPTEAPGGPGSTRVPDGQPQTAPPAGVRHTIRHAIAARMAAQSAVSTTGQSPAVPPEGPPAGRPLPDGLPVSADRINPEAFTSFRALRAQQTDAGPRVAPRRPGPVAEAAVGRTREQSAPELLLTRGAGPSSHTQRPAWIATHTTPRTAPGMPSSADLRDSAGQSPLHRAAEYGAAAPVRELVRTGASVDLPNAAGETPLLVAARAGKPEAAGALLEAGADVNARDVAYGETALHKAAMIGHSELARTLIAHGADLNAPSKAGSTPLHIAATANREEVARILLASGADVNSRDALGLTPLHRAVSLDAPALVKLLLAYGADIGIIGEYVAASLDLPGPAPEGPRPSAPTTGPSPSRGAVPPSGAGPSLPQVEVDPGAVDARGRTLLHQAVAQGDMPLARELLMRGADVNAAARFGETPLHLAAAANRPEMIELLLGAGASMEARDAVAGNTPLHLAATLGRAEATAALVAGGADVNAAGPQGQRALHIAVGVNHLEVVGQLLAAGADPNSRTQLGTTALSRAAFWGRPEAVELLAAHGADPNAANAQGRTPLYAAVMDGNDALAQSLLSRGAAANVRDNFGASPLHWAAARGSLETAHLLMLHGADAAAITGAGVTPGQAAQAFLSNITAFGLPYSHPRRADGEEQMPQGAHARDPEEAARRRYEELLWLVETFAASGDLPEGDEIPLDRTYANITLWGPQREQIAEHIREMSHGAYISPTVGGFTVVFDTACTPERPTGVWSRTADLAATFGCTALGVLNGEEGLLQYRLYVGGELVDEYCSRPPDADIAPNRAPIGGHAEALCRAFAATGREAQVEAILRRSQAAEDGPMFEIMRHRELALALGMPLFAVGSGYSRMEARESVPEAPRELLRLLVQPPAGHPSAEETT